MPAEAVAQTREPPGPFVVDARGVFAGFRQNETVAAELLVPPVNLPSHGVGLTVGAHWYPLHVKLVTIGLGGEWLTAHGSESLTENEGAVEVTVRDSLTAISPQLSINFGGRNGWSYISGGIGRAKLTMERADDANGLGSWRRAINYGMGARWFTTAHVAVSLDIRWYAIDEAPATIVTPLVPRMTLLMLSGGIAVR